MLQATIDVQILVDIRGPSGSCETSVRNAQAARAVEIIEQSTRPMIIMVISTVLTSVTLSLRYRLIDYVASRMLSPVA